MQSKSVTSSRAAAIQILSRVLQKHQALDDVLDETLKGLDGRDRALARAIVSTTLRHLGVIDALIDRMLERPLPEKIVDVRHALRIGITQILFLDIPSHAAVHDTVALIPERSKYKGLVNALLRRTDRQGAKLLSTLDAEKLNTPGWLWQAWQDHYGEDVTRRIAAAHRQEALLDITIRDKAEKWAPLLAADILPTGTLRRNNSGDIPELPGFEEGEWWIQDAAAALPARLFGDVRGKNILDICAAPGGKTAQLASGGAHVIALDRSKGRLKRLQQNMDRLKLEVEVIVAEAEKYTPATAPDGILLDAPCSSTGTLRRHPDVAYLKSPDDVTKLAALQSRLLDHAADILKPGGMLVYSVCSLQASEGEQQIGAFLARHSDFERLPVTAGEVGDVAELINPQGDLRCLPFHLGGMDGFFAARLRKIS
tara:strand:- start:1773 stop:3050 length:1278 start_codon:yes stop_codon:yes gene_type:complete